MASCQHMLKKHLSNNAFTNSEDDKRLDSAFIEQNISFG